MLALPTEQMRHLAKPLPPLDTAARPPEPLRQAVINRILAEKAKEIDAEAAEHGFDDLADKIRKRFAADSALSWDEALQQIVQDRLEAAR